MNFNEKPYNLFTNDEVENMTANQINLIIEAAEVPIDDDIAMLSDEDLLIASGMPA